MEHIVLSRFLLSRKLFILRLYPTRAHSAGKQEGICTLIRSLAFFPYFDANGKYGLAVFMNGVETSLEKLLDAYPSSFIHLVRISSSDLFFPE